MKKKKAVGVRNKLTRLQISSELRKKLKTIKTEAAEMEKIIRNNDNIRPEDIDTVFKDIDEWDILKLRLKLILQTIIACDATQRLYNILKDKLDRFGDIMTESEKARTWEQMADCVRTMELNGCIKGR
ncbi:MAG: hypothetical protein JNJ56_08310 [Ignavibacteria bacterium]|nr:hypothetical protein [Ignavibacteria bacterium]